jgi:hypothetical protein
VKAYVGKLSGAEIVMAEPKEHNDTLGFRVVYPAGYSNWIGATQFNHNYREVTRHEWDLLGQTDAEHQISAISDGEPTG